MSASRAPEPVPVPIERKRPVRALVVDDSAFARKVVREMLSGNPAIEVVGVARDGEEALDLVERLKPDVVTCDLIMPKLDGVGFLRRQMARRPLPVLLLSSAPKDADNVIEAFAAGAVDLVQKPTALATDDLLSIREHLVAKVTEAAGVTLKNLVHPVPTAQAAAPATPHPQNLGLDLIAIGISTGGPQALRRMLPLLPADFPVPIAIVLHMPVGYTALYAEKLNELCPLEVCEAAEGIELRPGRAVIAQAGRHLCVRRSPTGKLTAQLAFQPLDKLHRPSVDILFQSAAEACGSRLLGVVMTGMGDDGKEGAGWIKAQGGTVLTEDESSCVIYGMPRSVVEAGLSDAAVPLDRMAQALTDRI